MKNLFLVLKNQYYNEIKSGAKRIEYRIKSKYWINKFYKNNYENVIFQNGYSKKHPQLKFKIVKIIENNIQHDLWGMTNVEVFEIHFK